MQRVYLSEFGSLWSSAVDAEGHVYVLDRDAGQLLKLSPSGHLQHRWSVPPMRIPTQPSDLTGISVGPHNTLYLTDAFNYQVITVTASNGQIIASWDTHNIQKRLPDGPFGVAQDAAGNLYVPNFAFSDVEKYSPSGTLLMTFGHTCPQRPGSQTKPDACTDEGHLAPDELNHPDGIAVDEEGNVYISDHRSRRVVKFTPDGTQAAAFGPTLPAPYGPLGLTEGVAVDRDGTMYVEDLSHGRMVKLSPTGTPVAQWHAPKGYVPAGTPGMDAEGNLYVSLNAPAGPCIIVKLSPLLQRLATWK